MPLADYDNIAFKRLTDIPVAAIIALMNDPAVRHHLPLAPAEFGESECDQFIVAKERMWQECGFGPWAFVSDSEFIGWGGLQPEGDDVDVGLILRRKYWGAGLALYRRIVTHAFEILGVESVIALLPPSRIRVAALDRLGFKNDGELIVHNQRFIRYRLLAHNRP